MCEFRSSAHSRPASERLDAVESESELKTDRSLGPQRAVIVEGRDALGYGEDREKPSWAGRSTNSRWPFRRRPLWRRLGAQIRLS